MPRTSLIIFAALLGALGCEAVTVAPSMRVTAVSAPDGRDEPASVPTVAPSRPRLAPRQPRLAPTTSPDTQYGRPGIGDEGPGDRNGPGLGRQGSTDPNTPAAPGRPRVSRPAPSYTPDRPTRTTKSNTMPPPMVFFLARGDADACGPGCNQWIGADGAIDADAARRLRALLGRIGERKLPIFFHSPGGSVEGALAIGRLMRARGLTAGVAWTVPQGCDAKQPREESCDRLKRGGRELTAELNTETTMCFSACVYAIVGAATREIAPGARLGIHSSSFTFGDEDDSASARPSPRVMRETIEASYERLGRYFSEMGIDPDLVSAARAISNDKIRVLSRADIWRFKIDRRRFVEDGWRLSDPPTRAIHKAFAASRSAGSTDFRDAMVNLSCGAPDRLRVDVALEHGSGEAASATAFHLVAAGSDRVLKPRTRLTPRGTRTEYDLGSIDLPPAFFLAAGDSIAVSAETSAGSQDFAATLSTAGLKPALAKLLPQCGISASATKADAVPRKMP
ncbi:MAG TPA: hypothetical protein VKX28_18665 [Xanthobacteraceae bacterium]|nr:hypothetical protein [Xanthobacteraceae bacterium]